MTTTLAHHTKAIRKLLYKPSAAVDGGEVVVIGEFPFVTDRHMDANDQGSLAAGRGVYRMTADGAISEGEWVYWDATNEKVTRTKGSNKLFGFIAPGWTASADGDEVYVVHEPGLHDLGSADVVSVKWFGATGDGTTDDTAAIKAAITHASSTSSYKVYLPAGTYIISETISIPSYFEVYGDGPKSILKMSDDGEGSLTEYTVNEIADSPVSPFTMVVTDQSGATTHIYLHDFAIDGNTSGVQGTDIDFCGLLVNNSTYCTVERVDIDDCAKDGNASNQQSFCILFVNAAHCTLRGGRFGDAGYESVGIRGGCDDILVDGIYVVRDQSTEYGRHGLQAAGLDSDLPNNVRITNSSFEGWNAHIICHGATNCTIAGCRFQIYSDLEVSIILNEASYITVDSCFFGGDSTDNIHGIQILGTSPTPTDINICNCIAETVYYCLRVDSGKRLKIVNNNFKATGRRCISIDDVDEAAEDIVIANNTIISEGAAGGKGEGIGIDAASRVYIHGNYINSNAASTSADAIKLTNVTDAVVYDNQYVPGNSAEELSIDSDTTLAIPQKTARIRVDCSGGGSAQTAAIVTAPVGSVIHEVGYRVTESFDGDTTKTVEIGDGTDADEYVTQDTTPTAGDTKLMTVAADADVTAPFVVTTETTFTLTWTNTDNMTTGKVEAFVTYTPPY